VRNSTTNQGNFYQKFADENVDVEGQLRTTQDLRQYYGLVAFHPDANLEYLTNKTNRIFEWDVMVVSWKALRMQRNKIQVLQTFK